ncbi:hypothetical protein [Escherichia coli]|uniref:hypothetical protein n=1 Tax=Escherichia coli TaxID=562 RepID=UPI003890C213
MEELRQYQQPFSFPGALAEPGGKSWSDRHSAPRFSQHLCGCGGFDAVTHFQRTAHRMMMSR